MTRRSAPDVLCARFLTEPDFDRALKVALAEICHATGAAAGLVIQRESQYVSSRQWSFALPDQGPALEWLQKSLPQNGGEPDAKAGIDRTAEVEYAGEFVPLTDGDGELGHIGLAFRGDTVPPDVARRLQPCTPLLATRLRQQRESEHMQALLAQYERGFQTLDRQVRVLDLERQKLAAVLNNAEIGFLVVNEDLQVTWANPAMALNLNAAGTGFGILRQHCHEVVCGCSEPCEQCPARRAHEAGEPMRTELTSHHGETKRRLYAIAVPIRGGSGEVHEVLLMVQDLTGIDVLRQSEERYRLLFENSPDAIIMAEPPDFRVVMANTETYQLLGYSRDEISELSLAQMHAPEEWPDLHSGYTQVLDGRPMESHDCKVLDRNGEALSCNVSALPFALDGRDILMCTVRDITARKRAEQELAHSLSLLQGTLESTADGILVVNNEGHITSFNQKMAQMWRIPPEVLAAGDDSQALAWVLPQLRDPERYITQVRELYTQPDAESYDLILFKDGRVFERYSQPHRIEGKSVGRVWSFRDVTERKRAYESLQQRLQFENLISTLSTHFINLATEEIDAGVQHALKELGEFAGADRSYIFLFADDGNSFSNTHEWCAPGITPQIDRVQDVPCDAFPYVVRRMRENQVLHVPRVADLPAEAAAEQAEFQHQKIQSVVSVPIIYGKATIGFLGFDAVREEKRWPDEVVSLLHIASEFLANALARRRAESEKANLEEQLRQSQKMEAVGTLAGGIAHDFNNLLTGILGYADMLGAGGLSPEQSKKAADVIEKAARRAADLTQQLLGFARKGKYQNIPVDLHATIHEATSLLGRTLDKSIALQQNLRARDPFVLGDPVQVQQVILNLAVNARDAMVQGGTLTFSTERVSLNTAPENLSPTGQPREYIKLTVSDTGCGIPPQVQQRIFEPFFTTKEQGKGTGMGLSMVYGIVKNHGGSICVASEVDKGTRFEILLPATKRPDLVAEDDRVRTRTGQPATILVVDDEELVRQVAQTMLENLGYGVRTARDGQEAVALYRESYGQIDLVVLDMIMPRMGGRETFLLLKEINPEVRAILSTGCSMDETTQRILDEGMLGFAQKPYVLDELADTVTAALQAPLGATRTS
jgi:PAS domain S-box-containing protein